MRHVFTPLAALIVLIGILPLPACRQQESTPETQGPEATVGDADVTEVQEPDPASGEPDPLPETTPKKDEQSPKPPAQKDEAYAQTKPKEADKGAGKVQPPPAVTEDSEVDVPPPPAGNPVLAFLDMPGLDRSVWVHEKAALQRSYSVTSIPLPTNVVSGADKSFGPADLSETLARKLAEEEEPVWTLFAAGDAAAVAVQLALDYPDRVQSLVLLDGYPLGRFVKDATNRQKLKLNQVETMAAPVLALFSPETHASIRSAKIYMEQSGLERAPRVRPRRLDTEQEDPRALRAMIVRKIVEFLADVKHGKDIQPVQKVTLPSGLVYEDQIVGDGPPPRAGQTLMAKMRIRLPDGTDLSLPGGLDVLQRFPYDESLSLGLYEGLSNMPVGGKRKLRIPAKLTKRKGAVEDRVPPDAVLDGSRAVIIDLRLEGATDDPPYPPRPVWDRSKEKRVSDETRIVDLIEGSGYEVHADAIVRFAYTLWGRTDHVVRHRIPENPERDQLRVLAPKARCWLEGMVGMRPGGERLIISTPATFGDVRFLGIGTEDEIVFHVRLLDAGPLPSVPKLPKVDEEAFVPLSARVLMHEIQPGDGATPSQEVAISVHYTLWRVRDGVLDYSTRMLGEPWEIRADLVSQPWKLALPEMQVGSVILLRVQDPPNGRDWLEPGEWVLYQIELLEVLSREQLIERKAFKKGDPMPLPPQARLQKDTP